VSKVTCADLTPFGRGRSCQLFQECCCARGPDRRLFVLNNTVKPFSGQYHSLMPLSSVIIHREAFATIIGYTWKENGSGVGMRKGPVCYSSTWKSHNPRGFKRTVENVSCLSTGHPNNHPKNSIITVVTKTEFRRRDGGRRVSCQELKSRGRRIAHLSTETFWVEMKIRQKTILAHPHIQRRSAHSQNPTAEVIPDL
jgi:hypothetical protein